MTAVRTALPANPAERTHRRSRRPLSYRGSHRRRNRAASLVAVAVCASLPATVALGGPSTAPASSRVTSAAVATAAAAARPTPVLRPAVAVPAAAPVKPQRRLVGFRTRTEEVAVRSFTGRATWYGPGFHGRRTANGERFTEMAMTAAHRTLPFGTRLKVCTPRRCVRVRVNDRGPFGAGNVLDLSKGAARALGTERSGVARVTATVVRTQTVKVPIYTLVTPKPAPWTLRSERLSRPAPSPRTAGGPAAPVEPPVEALDVELVGDEREWSLLGSVGVGLGGLLLLGVMALPAWRNRRRKGLSFTPRR